MATTYLDYAIKYNGATIASASDTGLTSIPITYNGQTIATITSVGTKTLKCANKNMLSDVVIGAKTLKCAPITLGNATVKKRMKTDVQVTTTARYRWNKYYSNPYYAQLTTTINSGGTIWSGDFPVSMSIYVYGTSYSFDTTNGMYSISGGSWQTRSSGYGLVIAGNTRRYVPKPGTNPYTSEMAEANIDGDYGMITVERNGAYCTAYQGRARYCYSAFSQYVRGSYIGEVQSTDSNAYPSDARHSDGYWYTAI